MMREPLNKRANGMMCKTHGEAVHPVQRCNSHAQPLVRRFLQGCAAILFLLMGIGVADAQSADDLVRKVTDKVLTEARTNNALGGDKEKIAAMVDREVTPYVDFEGICRRSLGKAYALLDENQQHEFNGLCKQIIITTYSYGLTEFKNITVKVLSTQVLGNGNSVVKTVISQEGDDDIHIDYEMHKVPDNWIVTDVHIDGVSIVSNFFSQFASILRLNGAQALIEQLKHKLAVNRAPS
jgi:phospholipid transport system substrate-binding protein